MEEYYVIEDTYTGIELLGLDHFQATHYYTLFKRMERCKSMLDACNSLDSTMTVTVLRQSELIAQKDIYITQLEDLNEKFEKALIESEKARKKLKRKAFWGEVKGYLVGGIVGAAIMLISSNG